MIFRNPRLEKVKRRRERRAAVIVVVIMLLTIFVHALVQRKKEGHHLVESLTYLSVIYFYIFIGVLLMILVARNLIKTYLERKSSQLGANLKWKITVSLIAFSLIPSLVFFVGATALIRSGFDQYFGERVAGALEDSESIVKTHYDRIYRDLDLMAAQLSRVLKEDAHRKKPQISKETMRALPLSRLEIYRRFATSPTEVYTHFERLPPTEPELVSRAFAGESFRQTLRYNEGDLIQRFQSTFTAKGPVVLVLSTTVPLALNTRMEELKSALVVYQETRTLKNSLKTQYSIVLLVLFVLVLFVVTWFGIYITREITDPVLELLQATNAFRSGKWDFRIKNVGNIQNTRTVNPDLEILKSAFNLMAEEVGTRGQKLEEAVSDLERRERYLETLLSSIRRGVVVLDTEANIQRINTEAIEMLFWREKIPTVQEVRGKLWMDLFKIQPRERFADFLKAVKIKRGHHLDQVFEIARDRNRDLPMRSVRASGVLLLDSDGRDLGTLLILEDISDATRMERLAAWQGVARRVAHEIKNPLTPIQISADRIARRIAAHPPPPADLEIFQESLAQIQKQVRVIRDLVKEFGQFAKLPEPHFQKVAVTKVFENYLNDYRFTHPEVEFKLIKNVTHDNVKADPELLRILFVNLVDNALQSYAEKRSQDEKFQAKLSISIENSVSPNNLRLVFEDNGPGIDPQLRDKIFDPYVSSKASGMGLGLAIVRRIVDEHYGLILIEDSMGARFVVELPRYPEDTVIAQLELS